MSEVITQEYTEDGKVLRRIRSFVRREGRLTKGQEAAMKECWPTMGIDYQPELLDWQQVFGNDNPVVLEIGFGMGASLVEMAKNAPEKNFLGIEVHSPGVGACLASAREAGVTPWRVIFYNAVEVFAHMIPDNSLHTLQLFFPDPWHKKRHHKRRIVQLEFAEMVRQKLMIGSGVFHMATDWGTLAGRWVGGLMHARGDSTFPTDGDYVPRPDERPLTKFEQRGHRLGHGVWDIKYQRTA